MSMERHGGKILMGEGDRRTKRKNLSQCHFVHTNPTLTDPGANPALRCDSFWCIDYVKGQTVDCRHRQPALYEQKCGKGY
jgi:hypothetical protein